MHSNDLVHGDLKPANILIQDKKPLKPERPRIKITDFGFATYLHEDNETLNKRMVSAKYKAPEVINTS